MKKGPVKEVKRIYLNNFLDDEDSADADNLRKMVVDACVNVGVPDALDKSWVEIRDLLSRFIVYREEDLSSISNTGMPSVRYHCSKGIFLLRGVPMRVHFHRQVRDPRGRRRGQTIRHYQRDGGSETSSARSKGGC